MCESDEEVRQQPPHKRLRASSSSDHASAQLSALSDEMGAQCMYTRRLEELLRQHNIPIPSEAHPNAGMLHTVHYREGLWPTKIEIDPTTQLSQHLIVAKGYSYFSASIVNCRSENVHPHTIHALVADGPNFTFRLLCKPGNLDTFDCIRVPATGAVIPLCKLVTFAAQHKVDMETGAFRVDEPLWTLRFKPIVSSGCPRLTPKLFKVRIEPILSDEFCEKHSRAEVEAMRKQLTAESAPFRSLLRHHDSKALKAYRNKQQQGPDDAGSTRSESELSVHTFHTSSTECMS